MEEIQSPLLKHAHEILKKTCFIGFDGFTDTIYRPVKKRQSTKDCTHYPSIQDFGNYLSSRSGKSCNIELSPLCVKIGGNAPIMGAALAKLEQNIHVCAHLGEQGKEAESVFQDFTSICSKYHSLGMSGKSYILEFEDGKSIFGDMQNLPNYALKTFSPAWDKSKWKTIFIQAL